MSTTAARIERVVNLVARGVPVPTDAVNRTDCPDPIRLARGLDLLAQLIADGRRHAAEGLRLDLLAEQERPPP